MERNISKAISSRSTFWRDARVLSILFQIIFLTGVALLAALLYTNMLRGLAGLGLTLNFDFLGLEAGFGIAEGIPYQPSDTYLKAFWVGVVNTLSVSILGIVLASILGLIFGVARLSSNWLVRNVASIYVEFFRNIPLLLQILFWYTAVILQLPPVRQSISLFGQVFVSQRGIYLPWLHTTMGFPVWGAYLAAGLVLAATLYGVRLWRLRRLGRSGFPSKWAFPAFIAIGVLGWFMAPETPITLDVPILTRFNFVGGLRLSPEFSALLIGLSVYTGAFIAEVVRGGIQAVERGQREAAKAVGLTEFQVLRLVVLPQTLRIIVPPLTSQYLNLAKNSSLAIAVGFPDVFNVGNTMMNQTGQSIPVFMMIMANYLIMSLATSAFMNWYNRRVRIVER
jgi:general L-amino acid transport system permease protein